MRPVTPRRALAVFLSQVGARVAIAATAPLAAAAVAWLGIQQDPSAALRGLALSAFGPRAGSLSGLGPAAVALLLAGWAAPRINRGMAGWIRHLPVSSRDQRRAAVMALTIAELPLGLGLLALSLVAWSTGTPPSPSRLFSVPFVLTASACTVRTSGRRWLTGLLGGLALVFAAAAGWRDLVVAFGLLVASDLAEGDRGTVRHRPHRRRTWGTSSIPLRISLRALGPRVLTAFLAAALPLGATLLFLHNNDLDAGRSAAAVRLGVGLAITLLVASVAEPLAVRRPAWPWARSLPWSARSRVTSDALLLAAAALPFLAAAALLRPAALLPLCGHTVWVALRAAGALRRAAERRTGAAGEVLAEGALLAAVLSLVPWLALVACGLAPWALRAAANRDKSQRVSRWLERHHLAAGDSLSWSG